MKSFILYWVLALGCASAYCGDTPHALMIHTYTNRGTIMHGTAFPIGKHTILTAAHVLDEGSKAIEIDGKDVAVTCIRCDEELDIALLHCDADLNPFELAIDDAGEIKIFGSPMGKQIQEFAATEDRQTELSNRVEHCYRAPGVQSGCSGGPCIHDGKVIGMLRGTVEGGRVGIIPTRRIKSFIREVEEVAASK